jgi:aspartyl/asparaginyl beta-hydroxylase (cupin superfamily)
MLAPVKLSRNGWHKPTKMAWKTTKRVVPFGLAVYFTPFLLAFYVLCGSLDVVRNKRRTRSTIDRYFAGNGLFTWLLSPFNLLMDLLSLPYWNRGIYRLEDLPEAYQAEIRSIIDAAHARDVVGQLRKRSDEYKRGMFFFKWYGRNVETSLDVPEFHQEFRYIQTIGVSVFNKRKSTSKHYGPLRITLRVLYNINHIESDQVYIRVGNHTHYWRSSKLFIFDDTLQHQSCNESDEPRYCMFLDIQRPCLVPGVLRGVLAIVRRLFGPINSIFYRQWTFLK